MWKKILIEKTLASVRTDKSSLFKMPVGTDYEGYNFWFPNKLIRKDKDNSYLTISYTDEFTFRLEKSEKKENGSYEKVNEITLSAEEMEKYFKVITPKNNDKSEEE